jgi:hypothetical protein
MSSSQPRTIPGGTQDPKAVEFLGKLAEKTAQQKVMWKEYAQGFLAQLPDNVVVLFASSTRPPYQWSSLNVQLGNEVLFRVTKSLPDQLIEYASVSDPAQKYANDLFALIAGMKGNPLDKAIKSLEHL